MCLLYGEGEKAPPRNPEKERTLYVCTHDRRSVYLALRLRAAQKDINVIFPLTLFRELAHEGRIGALAERNYSYHGLTNIPRLVNESAPQWAQMLKDDGVDAVFLTAG